MRLLGVIVSLMLIGGMAIACASIGTSGEEDRKPGEYLLRISVEWKADSSGSKGARREVDIQELTDSLRRYVRWKSEIVALLGPPNRVRHATYPDYVASPDQAYTAFDYYLEPGCRGNDVAGAEVPCCSLYFATKPNQDSILRIGMRCVD